MIPYLFSAILLGKLFTKLILDKLVNLIPHELFISTNIPSVTEDLAKSKTYDFFEWGIFFVFSFLIYLLLYYLYRRCVIKNNSILHVYAGYFYLIFSVISFFIVLFATHSFKTVGLIIISFNIFFWFFLNFTKPKKNLINYKTVFNGFLTGLVISLILNKSSTVNLYILVFFPFLYVFLAEKFSHLINNETHLYLLIGIFFNNSKPFMVAIILVTALLILINKKYSYKLESLIPYLYLVSGIFVILYNPLFYIGRLDSVEEGFWLGWLQRLINKDFIYRDFYAYHPPFLIWFLYLFSKINSFSIYTARLYFHILYLLGMVFISLTTYKLIKNKFVLLTTLLIIFSLTGSEVKNNAEIRLGLGMLSLFILFINLEKNKFSKSVILSGIVAGISLFTSIEVGLTALISGLIYIFIGTKNKLKYYLYYFSGLSIVSLPTLIFLYINNALNQFLGQIASYSKNFSLGYFNLPEERPFELAFFYWHIFFEYLGSNMFYWFFVQLSFSAVLIWYFYRKFIGKKENNINKFSLILVVFGLLLSRSALGRSDYYHLIFILIIAVIVFFGFLDSVINKNKLMVTLIISLFTLTIMGNHIKYFVSGIVYKFQTYGKPIGNYFEYDTGRSGILFEDDEEFVNRKNNLIRYISENTSDKDSIFIFPWMPDLYFLVDRRNATSFDTPYAFLEKDNQIEMIKQLDFQKPRFIVYNPNFNFGNLNVNSLEDVNNYINVNYVEKARYGADILMERI